MKSAPVEIVINKQQERNMMRVLAHRTMRWVFIVLFALGLSTASANDIAKFNAVLDPVIAKITGGGEASPEDVVRCTEAFQLVLYDRLALDRGIKEDDPFCDEVGADFFVCAMRMSIVDVEHQGGWPYNYRYRKNILNAMKRKVITEGDDDFVLLGAIFSALQTEDADYAVDVYHRLAPRSPYLAAHLQKACYFMRWPTAVKFCKAINPESTRP